MGTILVETEGSATAIPPTALVTEIAGVRIPSAIVRLSSVHEYDHIRELCSQRTQYQTDTVITLTTVAQRLDGN